MRSIRSIQWTGCRVPFGKTENYSAEPPASIGLTYVVLLGRPCAAIRFNEVASTGDPFFAAIVPALFDSSEPEQRLMKLTEVGARVRTDQKAFGATQTWRRTS